MRAPLVLLLAGSAAAQDDPLERLVGSMHVADGLEVGQQVMAPLPL